MGEPVDEEDIFHTSTVFGAETRKPLVQVLIGKTTRQVTPDDARAMGEQLISTAFAAEADAFLLWWLNERVGQPFEVSVNIMNDFRKWRVQQVEQEDGT